VGWDGAVVGGAGWFEVWREEKWGDAKNGTHEDERTVLYKTKSLDGTKPNTNPNPKLTQILTLFSCFFRSPSHDLQSSPKTCFSIRYMV